MTDESFILVSLDDEKSKEIAEILGSKTCKKIISYLSENKEASEKDLSVRLKMPINTIEYNLKKLISSGFVQKRKNFFWSAKGKKILMYELSKKSVVISHKKTSIEKIKAITPALILTAAGTFAIGIFERISYLFQRTVTSTPGYGSMDSIAESAGVKIAADIPAAITNEMTRGTGELVLSAGTPVWAWFLAGALLAIVILSIVNWRKL